MRTYNEIKQLLRQIKDNDYVIPDGVDTDALITDMLKFVGHTDAEFRDELIYSTFSSWVDNDTLSAVQMKHILATCLDDQHLFFGIGESGTDAVFTRAFSSLLISVAIYMHEESPFLTTGEIRDIKETVLRYVNQEKDYRGYVDGKGWAHAVAHIADALANIAGCNVALDSEEYVIGREGMFEMLQAVKTLVCNSECVYTAEEDERLAVVFMNVIWSEVLTTEELTGWIAGFNMADNEWWNGSMPEDYYLHVNRKNFMRSLYFKLLADKDYEKICEFMLGFLVESEE